MRSSRRAGSFVLAAVLSVMLMSTAAFAGSKNPAAGRTIDVKPRVSVGLMRPALPAGETPSQGSKEHPQFFNWFLIYFYLGILN